MSSTNIGDSSQHFQSLRQTAAIKTRLNTLSNELSTGRIADLSTHLNGDVAQLALLDRDLSMLDSHVQASGQLAQTLSEKQLVLSSLDTEQTALAARLITITASSSSVELESAEQAGQSGFERSASMLNTRLGDRSLFAGAAVDGPAVAKSDDMLASILASIGGAIDAATITAAIDSWFDDPAGGFATMGYVGDTGAAVTQRIGTTEVLTQDGRADERGLRDILKAGAFAAVSDALSGTLDTATRATLVRTGGDRTFAATDSLRQIASRIGEDEQRVEEITARQSAQRSTIAMARNALVAADPFDTATFLQSVQQQLELHYTATARLSRMSLANYL